MTPTEPVHISSRDNPLVKELGRLSRESVAYRKFGRVWLEGDHLCRAALARGWKPTIAVFSSTFWPTAPTSWSQTADKIVVLADALFADVSGLESPAGMGFVMPLPVAGSMDPNAATVILDRVQDAGNVGSILRSAGAFGFKQVLAIKGTAALWSPKVLRAGMGTHFGLQLMEGLDEGALEALQVPLLVTSSHQGYILGSRPLPMPCAWAMGHEGQGVSPTLMARAQVSVRIGQPGGEESLNVAAAAAICLHASSLTGA